jgi:hypothetical protein
MPAAKEMFLASSRHAKKLRRFVFVIDTILIEEQVIPS